MTAIADTPSLFTPLKVGNAQLQHRVVLAPLTRMRANDAHVHNTLAVEYYAQRASAPGTLLITEGAPIAPQAGGFPNVPGIWNDEQIEAWKKITDAVHANGSVIYMQIWAAGRGAIPAVLEKEGPYDYVGPSAISVDERHATPRALSVEEIEEYVQLHVQAAKNAVHGAGFDGVEVDAANGYLLDEFLQTNSNVRTDHYGGTVGNRIRFVCEVVDAVQAAIGPERTGIRISPWATYQSMRMPDPLPTFSALIKHLAEAHPQLSYVHVIEPRVSGDSDKDAVHGSTESNDFIADIWSPRPLVRAGGYTRDLALKTTEREKNTLIAVGRHFTSNPDLVERWRRDVPLTPYERATFYTSGARGYSDWPFYVENKL